MVESKMEILLIRVCNECLKKCLGKTLKDNLEYLIGLHKKDYSHCCGEGGEFESFVLDCPLYKKKINVVE